LLHDSATPESVGDITSACVNRIVDAADSAGVNLSEPIIGLFPLDISDDVSVAVAVETNERIPGTTAAVLPGGTYAKAIHVGPYDQIGLTAHALMAWCAGHGHTLTGPLREVYVSNPGETANVELVTHLLIRLGDPA
jgi:effector-binding domain-containing protein